MVLCHSSLLTPTISEGVRNLAITRLYLRLHYKGRLALGLRAVIGYGRSDTEIWAVSSNSESMEYIHPYAVTSDLGSQEKLRGQALRHAGSTSMCLSAGAGRALHGCLSTTSQTGSPSETTFGWVCVHAGASREEWVAFLMGYMLTRMS